MSLWQFSGLLMVYLVASGFLFVVGWQAYCRTRFSFHLFFTLLFFLTFFFGFPLTGLLIFRFHIETVPAEYLLQSLLVAGCFYAVYYVSYRTGFRRYAPSSSRSPLFTLNRVEAQITALLLMLIAVVSALFFFSYNGFLLFKLHSYSQLFSSSVSAVALKRFFYFFIPAMLIVYFLRQTAMAWLFFLASTLLFGVFTYLLVGGTRANIIIAFALFLFIGILRGWITLWMLLCAGVGGIVVMFWLALRRYNLDVAGDEAVYTFLYLTRDTFSPWENVALLFSHYDDIHWQGIAPVWRDFYVYIPHWLWPGKPAAVLNSGNYFTWNVLNNHSGLAISPTLIGSLLVMGGVFALLPGAIVVGWIIKWFDWLYTNSKKDVHSRYKGAVLQSFCFGAIFNIIVLVREGLDAFVSRIVFFTIIFALCVLIAKVIYGVVARAGLIRPRLPMESSLK